MTVGIISDTHDNVKNILKAIKIFNKEKVSLVIHCGDWVSPYVVDFFKGLRCEIISVFGNNEGYKQRFITLGGKNIKFHNVCVELNVDNRKVAVYHGDAKPLTGALIDSQKYDAVFTGDTHVPLIEKKGKTLHVNPGTVCGEANGKIMNKSTVAIYNPQKNTAKLIRFQ